MNLTIRGLTFIVKALAFEMTLKPRLACGHKVTCAPDGVDTLASMWLSHSGLGLEEYC